jgi:transketolase
MSVAEIVAVLYFHEMHIDADNPKCGDRDRFILSKGHACFTQYAALAKLGIIPEEALSHPYEVDSMIQAHPELGLTPGIEMSTGALGQGLSAGIGMAIGARLRKKSFRVYVVLSDGELDEGQVWEAAMTARKYRLDNLVALVDYNAFSLSGRITEIMPLEPLADKWTAFGWHVIQVNGHSVSQLVHALDEARGTQDKPTIILSHTVKGRGISFLEDRWDCHATPLSREQAEHALRDLDRTEEEIQAVFQ